MSKQPSRETTAPAMFDAVRYALSLVEMSNNAAETITRRVTRMATGRMTLVEATEMTLEKAAALVDSNGRAWLAMSRGESYLTVMDEALAPYGDRTRSNVDRLRG